MSKKKLDIAQFHGGDLRFPTSNKPVPTLPDISRWHDEKNTRKTGKTFDQRKRELRAMGEAGAAELIREVIVENADTHATAEALLEMFGKTMKEGRMNALLVTMANCLENHEAYMREFPYVVRRVVEEE